MTFRNLAVLPTCCCRLQRTGRDASGCNSSGLWLQGALCAYRPWHYISGKALLLFFSRSRIHNSMQHSYSWEFNGFTAIQEIPYILCNPKMQYHVPNSPPLSSWAGSIHSTPFLCMKIQFNVIIPFNPTSSKWPFPLKAPHQTTVCNLPASHTCYMLRPSHPSSFDPPNNMWWAVVDHDVPLYAVFFTPLLGFLSWAQTLSPTPSSQTPSCASRTSRTIHHNQFPPHVSQFFIHYYHKIRNFMY